MDRALFVPVCEHPEHLVEPSRLDPYGVTGPTRGQARGSRWVRCAPGLYVPRSRPEVVEQRILEQARRLPGGGAGGGAGGDAGGGAGGGAVTGWAALRWWGASYFDGSDDGGRTQLPVPLLMTTAGQLRSHPSVTIGKTFLNGSERREVHGITVSSVQRALFDEVTRRGQLWAAVHALDMTFAAGLISATLFAAYLEHRTRWIGVPLNREALALASEHSRSPRETWMRLVWLLRLELDPPLVNTSVYDLDGDLIGIPDLFDPVAGLVAEYDGEHHEGRVQQQRDRTRETRFRDHGLEYVAVVRGDRAGDAAYRIYQARERSKFLPTESCAWTLERPVWCSAPESLDARLARLGRVPGLSTW